MTGFNLSTYYYTDKRIAYPLFFFLILLVVAFTLYNVMAWRRLALDMEQTALRVSEIKKQLSLLKKEVEQTGKAIGTKKERESLARRVFDINAILERKSFSWSELLYSLERASPRDVSITRVKPSYETKRVRISGLAKSLNDVTALVDNLRDTTYIKKSFLLKQGAARIGKKKHPAVTFEIISEGK